MTIVIRKATAQDADQVASIFAYYVINSVATYLFTPPSTQSFLAKIERSLSNPRFPFYVASDDDTVIGYTYASEYRTHDGYVNTVEDSIFVHPDHTRRGVGRRLLRKLIEDCKEVGYRVMIAIFGAGREQLEGTFKLHEAFGFREVGRLLGVGEKFGKILDTPILQLDLQM
jgi:L-amino acid N-acyltransferase YncA